MIPMQQNSSLEAGVTYLVGSREVERGLNQVAPLPIFAPEVLAFLTALSRELLTDSRARAYPEVITFAFFIRRGSLVKWQQFYAEAKGRMGRGVAFQVAPSNVPVNFAYTLVAALLAGNATVVRVPQKNFAQVEIICAAMRRVLKDQPALRPYVLCVRYGHEKSINDRYSALATMRVVWGGDRTIAALRQSPLPPRANEITFADRHSLAVISAAAYLAAEDGEELARGFYNDTYLTDQNACTAPRLVFWLGTPEETQRAQQLFWERLHRVVAEKYELQAVQAVDKLDALCRVAADLPEVAPQRVPMPDVLITRCAVSRLVPELMDDKMHSGFFFEMAAETLEPLAPVCGVACQTVSYYGVAPERLREFVVRQGLRGVDRIVPIGRTLDFSLIWDGCDLIRTMSRWVDLRGKDLL